MHRMKEGPMHQMKEGPMHRMKEGPMHRIKWVHLLSSSVGQTNIGTYVVNNQTNIGTYVVNDQTNIGTYVVNNQTNIGTYVVNNQTIEYELFMKDLFNTVNNVFHWPSLPSSYHSSFPPPCISQTVYNPPCISQTVYNPPCISQTVYNPPCISQTGYNVANLPVVHVCRLLSMAMVSCTCSCIKTSFDTRAT